MPTATKSRKGIGGPKTKEGKERVRLNALKMGLYANSIEGMQAVADVIGVSFESIHKKMRAYYRPADPIEQTLVHRIARCSWKLMVLETMEDHTLTRLQIGHGPGKTLESISIIERRTDVQLHRAIAALNRHRNTVALCASPEPRTARHQENMKNKLPDPELDRQATPLPGASLGQVRCPIQPSTEEHLAEPFGFRYHDPSSHEGDNPHQVRYPSNRSQHPRAPGPAAPCARHG